MIYPKLIIIFLLSISLFAQIDINTKTIQLGKHVEIFLDKEGKYTIEEIIKDDTLFTPSQFNTINFGMGNKKVGWVKFQLTNTTNDPIRKTLSYTNSNTEYINLYSLHEDGSITLQKSGALQEKEFKKILRYLFEIEIQPHTTQVYYLQAQSLFRSLNFSLSLDENQVAYQEESTHMIVIFMVMGLFIALWVYNAIIFLYIRNKLYLYYLIYFGGIIIDNINGNGIIYFLAPYDDKELLYTLSSMSIYFLYTIFLGSYLFSRYILQVYRFKYLNWGYTLLLLVATTVVLISTDEKFLLPEFFKVATFSIIYSEILAIYAFYKRIPYSIYYLTGWNVALICTVIKMFLMGGHFQEYAPYLRYIYEFGVSVEMIFFSIILVKSISDTQRDTIQIKNDENIQLIQQLKETNSKLEERIANVVEEKLQKEKMLYQKSRLAAMGEMIENIAHQWRQPLMSINASLINLKRAVDLGKLTPEYLHEKIKTLSTVTEFMSNTIDDFRGFYKIDKEKTTFNIFDELEKILKLMSHNFKNTQITVNGERAIVVNTYKGKFAQVIMSLLTNSVEILNLREMQAKQINIDFYQNQDSTTITIEDNGVGINLDSIEKIFDPYFTTKHSSGGTGLGLYITKMIVTQNMHGNISVENTKDGAKFIITLPRSSDSTNSN